MAFQRGTKINKPNTTNTTKETKSEKEEAFIPQFTREEAIWMMSLIKNCTFKGEEVQKVYESVVKLQLIVNDSK